MNWVIIGLVVLSIIGSVMWMMPSPRERMQAKLRQKAMTEGMKVQMVQLTCPRATGEAEAETRSIMAYRLFRQNLSKQEKSDFNEWQVFKLQTLATEGLPDGWSWSKGEGKHDAHQNLINEVIEELPAQALSLQSTGSAISLYWQDSGTEDTVLHIKSVLNKLVDAKI